MEFKQIYQDMGNYLANNTAIDSTLMTFGGLGNDFQIDSH